ncbi:phosphogluconate dehydrogenase C-terminal domain-containing protein [Planococcus sp. CAU13]|uniref:phosphogluconate dehydrogenase C-terminal domain-containing protein n=1 Tax=Planococcus sp. CAU13 TaxID=1541197 RepID=UPI00052FFCAC|nr:phosphogluconate dehydrogenase C-terminal domain-containing protein [Planococcus sp. CAU13]
MRSLTDLKVTLVGAGGKMGTRISNNLADAPFQLRCVESSERNLKNLEERNLKVFSLEEALPESDYVILAVPDIYIKAVSSQVKPLLKSGAVVITLDPAAAYANQLVIDDDHTSIVAHPCHPSVFLERYTKEEYDDAFGGVAAPQDVVVAVHSGDDAILAEALKIIELMYAPVVKCHVITVEQMAILEPTLVETITCMIGTIFKESLDETIKLGVPEEAAKAMLYGHINIALAVALKGTNPFSDACLIAIDLGKEAIIQPDWKKVFEKDHLDLTIQKMLKLS